MPQATFTVRSKKGPVLTITAPEGTSKKDVALVLSHRVELKEVSESSEVVK